MALLFAILGGCESDLSMSLDGRECGPSAECVSGYVCDVTRNLCVRPGLQGSSEICNPDEQLCNGNCIRESAFQSDPNNCGGCGIACENDEACTAGRCFESTETPRTNPPADPAPAPAPTACLSGYSPCAKLCIDFNSDPRHCGACNAPCPNGVMCENGKCRSACSNRTECSGACVDVASDAKHCGACGNECSAPLGAVARCAAGKCEFDCQWGRARCDKACEVGRTLCGAECVNLKNDAHNCGKCGEVCEEKCADGKCKERDKDGDDD